MPNDLRDQLQKTLGDAITIDRELSGGGMSRVFVATDVALDRQVVVKMLPSDALPTASLERFNREIRTAAKLQHPHIVPVLSAGETGGLPFYTMPFVPGESLRHRLSKGGELSVNEAIHVLRDIAAALAYAHGEGVVHRDIKPENVMLSGGVAVVTDFGVAKAVDVAATDSGRKERDLTSLGVALGTPAYMSPEQATADPHVDHRSDIYSFGCVAYEMLAGVGPFAGRTPQQLLAAHVQVVPESLLQRRPSVPPALGMLVMRCLEKRPGDRPQTADELIVALDAIATPSGGTTPTAARVAAVRPRTRWMAYGVAIALVAGASLAYWLLRHPPSVQLGEASAVASGTEVEVNPAISPDGKFVAYTANSSGGWRIFVKQVAGGRATMLTGELDGAHLHPKWSPDGSQIAFEAKDAAFVIPAFGGAPRQLIAPDSGTVLDPTWSPDGSRIAYSDETGIWVRQSGGGLRRVIAGGGPYHSFAWSPDGRMLAYIAGNRPNFYNMSVGTIWIWREGSKQSRQVSGSTNVNMSPAFLPDGSLLYISNQSGTPDVFQQSLRSDGSAWGKPLRLTTGLFARTISVSLDGRKMAYDSYRNRSKIWQLVIPASGSARITDAQPVTRENERIEGVRVSHDGAWLAYDSDRSGRSHIYKIRLDGSAPVQLTDGAGNDFSPSWSPDDRQLTYHSARNGDRDVYITGADGGAEQRLTSGPSQDYWPDWSPDGRRIAYGSTFGPVAQFEIHEVERAVSGTWSAPRLLGVATRYCVRYSPDGARLALFVGSVLTTVGRSGGNPLPVWDAAKVGELGLASAWSRDGRTLYTVTVLSREDLRGIWAIPLGGGEARLLLREDAMHRFGRWDFDTDGKRLFFTLSADESDVWVVDLKR